MENVKFAPDKRRATDEQLFFDMNDLFKRLHLKMQVYSRNAYEHYEQNLYLSYYENGKRKQSAVYSVLDKYGINKRQIMPKLFAEVNKQMRDVNQTTINQLYTALMELSAKLQSGTAAAQAKKNIMLFDYVAQLQNENTASGKQSRQYRQLLKWLQDTAQDCKLQNVNADYIKTFLQAIAASGIKKQTQKNIYSTLRAVLNRAERENIIAETPLKRLGRQYIPRAERNAANIHYLTKDEVCKVMQLHNAETNEQSKKALQIFLFQCFTGFRIGDIMRLKWENIDFEENTIYIVEQKTDKPQTKTLTVGAKNYLPKPLTNGGGLVFGDWFKETTRIDQLLKRYDKTIGKHLHTHTARHTFATLLLKATNGNLAIVQKELNHSTITTTAIYAKVLDTERTAAMQKFDTFVNDNIPQ